MEDSLKKFSDKYFRKGDYKNMPDMEHAMFYTGIDKESFNIRFTNKRK